MHLQKTWVDSLVADIKAFCQELNLSPDHGKEMMLVILECDREPWGEKEIVAIRENLFKNFKITEKDFIRLENCCFEIYRKHR